jgi:dienelactone hydrolase
MRSRPEPTLGALCRMFLALIGFAFNFGPGGVRGQVRPEIYPVETVTLGTQQILTGERNGQQALVAGELRMPPGKDRVPAVILVHGSDGLSLSVERWAQELNGIDIAAFLLDSFSGRGITSTVNDQSKLHGLVLMVDAYNALGILMKHPRIDANRIAIMGFSKGAIAAVYASNERFRKIYAPASSARFAAHIGLYANCNITYHDDDKVTGAPIRLFHGSADDWFPIGPCRAYVDRLKKSGVDATLTEYPGAQHGYDFFFLGTESKVYSEATTTRNCRLEEGEHGLILNSKTAKPYDVTRDPCVERGPHVRYSEAATAATAKAVKEFLITTLKSSQ